MEENQNLVPNLSEMMNEYAHGEEEVHLEPQPETVITEEPEAQPEEEQPTEEGRKEKRQRSARHNEEAESEDEKTFVSAKAHALWNKQFADKGFIGERGFGKLISPFSKIIEKKGWDFFCKHKALGFAALAREFYSNILEMREDSVYVRGVWVSFDHKRINEVFQLKDLKHGSNFKKLVEKQDHEKIVNLLTAGRGKWEAIKKNPHQAINRGSLVEEAKDWFYFIASVIIPIKHLCSVREHEVVILYALLKGYKMNVGRMIED